MSLVTRRDFLQTGAMTAAGASLAAWDSATFAQIKGDRPKSADGVAVLNPRGRVPVSFIIDDSTCLVNLAHFCIPQFAEMLPSRYKQDWRKRPREIPTLSSASSGSGAGSTAVNGHRLFVLGVIAVSVCSTQY